MKELIKTENTNLSTTAKTDILKIPKNQLAIGNFRNNLKFEEHRAIFRDTLVELLFATFGEKSTPDNTIDLLIAIIEDNYRTFTISDIQQAFIKCAPMVDTRIYNGHLSPTQVTQILDKYDELYRIPKKEQEYKKAKQEHKDLFQLSAPRKTLESITGDIVNICKNIKTVTILLKRQDRTPVLGEIDYKLLYAALVKVYQLNPTEEIIKKYRDLAKIEIGHDHQEFLFMPSSTESERYAIAAKVKDRQRAIEDSGKISETATLLYIRDFIFFNF